MEHKKIIFLAFLIVVSSLVISRIQFTGKSILTGEKVTTNILTLATGLIFLLLAIYLYKKSKP